MKAKTNILVYHPVEWNRVLNASVPSFLLNGYTSLQCISFQEVGVGRAAFLIPKGTEYKRVRGKYYSETLKRVR